MKNLNCILKELRISLGYSQEIMADHLCMCQSSYNRLEKGKHCIKLDHIEKISKIDKVKKSPIYEKFCEFFHTKTENISIDTIQKENTILDNDYIKLLIEEKDKRISERDEVIRCQSIIIFSLQRKLSELECGIY